MEIKLLTDRRITCNLSMAKARGLLVRIFQESSKLPDKWNPDGSFKKMGHTAAGYNTFHSYLGYQKHLFNTDAATIRDNFKQILNFYDIFIFIMAPLSFQIIGI